VCILVVDDDVSVCTCIAEFLRLEGHDVAETFDGFRALAIAKERGQNINVVLTDVNMPGMDGIEMWKQMKPLLPPDCKVVFMSGMAQRYLQDGSQIPGELIQKPFLFPLLVEKLFS